MLGYSPANAWTLVRRKPHGIAAFRPFRQGRRRHRLEQGHRQVDRDASCAAGRQGRGVEPQAACLRGGRRRDQEGGRRGDRHPVQHLRQGAVREADRRDQGSARAGRRAGLQRGDQPLLRADREDARRSVHEDHAEQHPVEHLADHQLPARHARQEGRLDHHRLVDRRCARHAGDRRLRHLQGGRHAACAQPRDRAGAGQYPHQHHRARPGADRLRQGLVGQSRVSQQAAADGAAPPHRRA